MPFDWITILTGIGSGALGGLVTSVVTPYFSARFDASHSLERFKREQRWTEMRDSYYEIIRQLSDAKLSARAGLTYFETGGHYTPVGAPPRDGKPKLDLRDVASVGTLVVSARTVEAVKKFCDAYYDGDPNAEPSEELEAHYGLAEEALTVVKAEAERALGKASVFGVGIDSSN